MLERDVQQERHEVVWTGSESTGTVGDVAEDELIEQTVEVRNGKTLNFPTKLCWTDSGEGGGATLAALDVAVVG